MTWSKLKKFSHSIKPQENDVLTKTAIENSELLPFLHKSAVVVDNKHLKKVLDLWTLHQVAKIKSNCKPLELQGQV